MTHAPGDMIRGEVEPIAEGTTRLALRHLKTSAVFGIVGGGGILAGILYGLILGRTPGAADVVVAALGLTIIGYSAHVLLPGYSRRFLQRYRGSKENLEAMNRRGLEVGQKAIRVLLLLLPIEILLTNAFWYLDRWRTWFLSFVGVTLLALIMLLLILRKWRHIL